jgi:LacI family transcriptional regulator
MKYFILVFLFGKSLLKRMNVHASKKTTLKDIALIAGVTINTVSRALKDKEDISGKTKKRIKKIAEELGYIPNNIAGSLRIGKTRTIAVIVPDIIDPLFAIWLKDIEKNLSDKGYNIFIINTDEDYEKEENAIILALSKNADGIILCPTQKEKKDIIFLKKNHIPFVLLGRRFDDIETDYAISEDIAGGYMATKHLIDSGKKRILFLNGNLFISSARERLEGYKKALHESAIAYDEKLTRNISITSGHPSKALRELIQDKIHFDAVFAFSDLMAWEVIYCLQDLGFHVPQDIDVVGYDNIQSRFFYPYPLKTVNYSKRVIAYSAVEALLKKINEPDAINYYKKTVKTNLVIR